ALEHLDRDIGVEIYIIDGGFRQDSREKLLKSISILSFIHEPKVHFLKPPSDIFEEICSQSHSPYPPSAYYRLFIPDLVPESVERIIYLDSDVLVKADLAELASIDFDDHAMLAVQDFGHLYVQQAKHLSMLDFAALKIDPGHKYMNTGMLVLNLKKWRSEKIDAKMIDFLTQNPELFYPDQDALNIVLAGQWKEIDPRWNQTHIVYRWPSWQDSPFDEKLYRDLVENPFITHFTGRPKPWMPNSTHPQTDDYLECLNKTVWADWMKNPLNRLDDLWQRGLRKIRRGVSNLGIA
ncbi:MAG: glycosyltransferase family 8 protein, partial [Nodosilinea sp.]